MTVALMAVALAGCAPLAPTSEQRPPPLKSQSGTGREPDCSRQFDDNGAGFQLCRRGDAGAEE